MDRGGSAPTMTSMETKKNGTTMVVTEGAAQAALRRGAARQLTAEEERVMRMRLGATPPRTAPLERTATVPLSDLEIEVLSSEIEAYMKWRAQQPAPVRAAARALPRTTPVQAPVSRTKEKIVRALRNKA